LNDFLCKDGDYKDDNNQKCLTLGAPD